MSKFPSLNEQMDLISRGAEEIIPEDNLEKKINEHIDEVKDSCDIYSGINNGGEGYVAPTIIINPPDSSRIVNEETFGPVMSIRPFKSENELIEKIHKTGYGLSSSIFGKDSFGVEVSILTCSRISGLLSEYSVIAQLIDVPPASIPPISI